jgi:inner membrane protein
MTGKTHLAAGIATGLATCMLLHTEDPALVVESVVCSSLGSLMPDIDCESACISRLGLLSRILSKICSTISSHRRFWHTPIAGLIFATSTMLLFMGIGSLNIPFLSNRINSIPIYIPFIMFYLGYLSHLLLDSCNPQGVPWLWPTSPISKKIRFKRIAVTTASNKEVYYNILCVLTAFALTIVWIAHFYHDILNTILTKN